MRAFRRAWGRRVGAPPTDYAPIHTSAQAPVARRAEPIQRRCSPGLDRLLDEPFGGASGKRTGWGRIGGRYTMLDMTDLKTVVLDVGGLD